MMTKPKVFIGSSVDGLLYAQAFEKILNSSNKFKAISWDNYFKKKAAGKVSLNALYEALKDYDLAIFFITKDYFVDFLEIDSSDHITRTLMTASTQDNFGAKPNVWFELGMFMGRLEEDKALFILEENDATLRPILTLSDLYGLNPLIYNLDDNCKTQIIKFSRECQNHKPKKQQLLSDLDTTIRATLMSSLNDLYKNCFNHNSLFSKEPKYYTVQQLFSRDECYEQGFKIIREAHDRVFTILSYEDERTPTNKKYKDGLWPEIKKKIESYQRNNVIKTSEFKSVFKRFMNIANNDIYSQAHEILEKFANEIEIRDTFCNFIEVVITDDKVLIVLPNPKTKQINVEAGILIHAKKVADEFAEWFTKLLPEPNGIDIDSKEKLDKYRDWVWKEHSQRKEVNGSRCNACFIKFDNQPQHIKNDLVSFGLK